MKHTLFVENKQQGGFYKKPPYLGQTGKAAFIKSRPTLLPGSRGQAAG
jgi:hypothetical protein